MKERDIILKKNRMKEREREQDRNKQSRLTESVHSVSSARQATGVLNSFRNFQFCLVILRNVGNEEENQ